MPRRKKQEKQEKKELTREQVLKMAKELGLFQKNREFKRYEIIISFDEYEGL